MGIARIVLCWGKDQTTTELGRHFGRSKRGDHEEKLDLTCIMKKKISGAATGRQKEKKTPGAGERKGGKQKKGSL